MKKVLFVLLLVMFLVAGCADDPAMTVKTHTINTEDIIKYDTFSGEVVSASASMLAFQVDGTIATVNVKENGVVREGDVLFALIPQNTSFSNQNVIIPNEQAKVNYEKYKKLYEMGAISAREFEKAKNDYEKSSVSSVAKGTASKVGDTFISADVDGIVSDIKVKTGEKIKSGQILAKLVKSNDPEVEINIPEYMLKNIKKGDIAVIKQEGQSAFKGIVKDILPVHSGEEYVYKVRFAVLENKEKLLYGQKVSVYFENKKINEGVKIPVAAVITKEEGIFIGKIGNGKVVLTIVTPVKIEQDMVEVYGDLKAGDIIVYEGLDKVKDGQNVKM